MSLPWIGFFYAENISGAPLAFTLRKFVENPALVGFLLSLNVAFNFLVGLATSYMSDRIWTRWGRRKPFLVVGWIGAAVCLAVVPLAPNLGTLMVAVLLYQFFGDIAKPLEPLTNEIVPPEQRGRWMTIRGAAQNLMNLLFYGVLVSRFDAVYDIEAWGRTLQLRGDVVLYWTGSLLLLLGAVFLVFKVRETPPPGGVVRERFALVPFFREIFGRRQWWTVYLLYSVPLISIVPFDTFSALMQTEQLGFSRAQFGGAVSVGVLINVVIFIPVAGFLTDRVDRLRLMQIGICLHAAVYFSFFFFLRYVADYSISLRTLIAFGAIGLPFQACVFVVWAPLVYDYIPRDRYGTVAAGLAFIGGITPFLIINLAGWWVTTFTRTFGPRGEGSYDYSSIYILQALGAGLSFVIFWHVRREERLGRLIRYGRQELDAKLLAAGDRRGPNFIRLRSR